MKETKRRKKISLKQSEERLWIQTENANHGDGQLMETGREFGEEEREVQQSHTAERGNKLGLHEIGG